MEFASGLVETIRPASEGQSTDAFAKAQMADGVPGAVVDVGGVAVWEVPRDANSDLGSVRFVVEGSLIVLVGDRAPDVLRSVAESTIDQAAAAS